MFYPISKSTLYAVVLAALLFGLLAGLRLPNLWSSTQLLFTYEFGLIKRGFVGSLLSLLNERWSYWSLAFFSIGVFIIWLGLFGAYCRRIARKFPDIWLIVAAYFLSSGFLYLLHTVGYFDHIGILICIVCLFLPVSKIGQLVRIPLCILLSLVHEGLFLTVFPVIFFDLVLRIQLARQYFRLWDYVIPVFLAVSAMVTTLYIGQQALSSDQREVFTNFLSERAIDFPIRGDVAEVQFRGASSNASMMVGVYLNDGGILVLLHAVSVALPYVGMMFLLMAQTLHSLIPSRQERRAMLLLAMACALAPLVTVALAWDLHRFASFTQTTSTLIFLSMASSACLKAPQISGVSRFLGLIFAATLWNVSSELVLLDELEHRRPPFFDVFRSGVSVFFGDGTLDIPSL